MGDNNFHIKNNRLRRFYENADRFTDEDFAKQERREDDYVKPARLSMDFPKQAVEALSRIADDKDFPLQEMSDKEILSIGVFLHNVGNLFYHEGEGGSRTKLSEEIAGMDDSALKDFYRGILSTEKGLGNDYDVIKDKGNRKYISEFIYQIIDKDNYFIIEMVTNGTIGLPEHERRIPPGAFNPFKPCSEGSVRDTLLNYIYEKTEQTITDEREREDYIINNKKIASRSPRRVKDAQCNDAGLPKRTVFAQFYNNL